MGVRRFSVLLMLSLLGMLASGCGAPQPLVRESGARADGSATASGAMPDTGPAAMERTMELIAAAECGDVAAVKRLLARGVSVDARDGSGKTALLAAAYRNHVQAAEILIAAGADVNAQDHTQQSAYLIATSEGYLELLHLTLQQGANVRSTDSYNGTGLIRAAECGHVEIIEALLKTDIDVNHVNRLGWTALLEAIILGDGGPRHTDVVRLLVAAGADLDLADGDGVAPLTHARQRNYHAIVAILEHAGA